jgi:enoyl-CoA hydratase/carnithine racemase
LADASTDAGQDAHILVRLAEVPGQPQHQAAIVTLNRPAQRNCVSLAMWKELAQIFERLGQDPAVRAIVLTGAGGHFSAGADISEFASVRATAEQAVEYEIAVDACCDAIANCPKPTLAVVEGFCMGGGCHLAMSCDFRIAAPGAQFAIPAARLSIVYGVRGTQRLLALVGLAQAKRILYSAQKIGAEEGLRIGFFDQALQQPLTAALAFASTMADNAPLSIAGAKVLLNGLAMGMGSLDDATVNDVVDRAVASEDYSDARQAFVEKRAPVFRGR